ncbi:MAG: hypothetical protein WCB97_04550 [Thiobacillus sp.]
MKKTLNTILAGSLLLVSTFAFAATPVTQDGVTTIHLDQYGGYFAAEETLAGLKPGKYRFVVSNKTNKVTGFQIQDFTTHKVLDMFPLDPGKTRTSEVNITENGFRYRCPINPTPWYEVENVSAK